MKLAVVAALAALALCGASTASAKPPRAHIAVVAAEPGVARLRAALVAGHVAVYRVRPTPARLRVALAQTMLETGRGRRLCGGNVGQIFAGKGEPRCRVPGRRGALVRRFRSLRSGAAAYWRLRAVQKALPAFDANDPATAARMLGAAGYYQDDRNVYAAGMVALHAELSR